VVFVLLFFILGLLTDFISNGVFKIGTAWVWGTTYVGIACIIATELLKSRWEPRTRYGVIAFLIGSFGGHFIMSGCHSTRVYSMALASSSPITLRSDQWPQMLLVTSDKLSADLAHRNPGDPVSVSILVTTDYGCIHSFIVDQVAGIDVRLDPAANWVWKTDPHANASALSGGPGLEDHALPWCPHKKHDALIF